MYGLKDIHIDMIKSVFTDTVEIEKAILYGSRAKGNYWKASDIDLSLVGKNLDLNKLLRLETKLDNLLLPYKIDISIFNNIDNIELLDHINRVGIVFYVKES